MAYSVQRKHCPSLLPNIYKYENTSNVSHFTLCWALLGWVSHCTGLIQYIVYFCKSRLTWQYKNIQWLPVLKPRYRTLIMYLIDNVQPCIYHFMFRCTSLQCPFRIKYIFLTLRFTVKLQRTCNFLISKAVFVGAAATKYTAMQLAVFMI